MVALLTLALPSAACELDGLSHGYGPMSALFAGAHRYQSLNGLEDEESPPEPPPPAPEEAAAANGARPASSGMTPPASPPTTPPRSFVAWARAKPKPADASPAADGSPPPWVRTPVPPERANAVPNETKR